jgi:hypothetical protein
MKTPPPAATGDRASDDVREALRSLRVTPPDDGFSVQLRERLLAAGPPPAPGLFQRWRETWARHPGLFWPVTGTAAGALAGTVMFVILALTRGQGAGTAAGTTTAENPGGTAAQSVALPTSLASAEAVHQIPTDKVAVIRLNFTAEVAITDVAFEVRLPEGLAFWSGGRRLTDRTFGWRGDLAPGDNPMPVAVRGERPGRYRVVATAEMNGRRIEHALVLEVTGV